jgi:uncharacterized repeat protein (TIGR03803 family)
MKIRIHRLCTPTLITLLSLFAFAVQAGAQDTIFNPLSRLPKFRGKTQNTNPAGMDIGGVPTGYNEEVLYTFCAAANCADGANPSGGLIQDAAGNLYGTTSLGGANGAGTVFKVDDAGQETVLYSFCSASNCTDGSQPGGGVIEDAAGNLYGTTADGGANGVGTIFKLAPPAEPGGAWTETVLHSFAGLSNDGAFPGSGLIQDAAGNFYGTTPLGGANVYVGYGGTVFELDSTGHETVLYNFCSVSNCTDGDFPLAGLIRDAAGNLYGTTDGGGISHADCSTPRCGTVFKLAPPAETGGTWTETVLYPFCSASNCTDGDSPQDALIEDDAGNFYGTTAEGGANNEGTVFKVDSAGHETVLYSFCSSNCTDGALPFSNLIEDTAGNFYGTTYFGGTGNGGGGGGTVFKVGSTGEETVLYSFCSEGGDYCTDGEFPHAGLIEDAKGNFYGTTTGGGNSNSYCTVYNSSSIYTCGTVFKIVPVGVGKVTVKLTSSLNPSYVDQPVTFSVDVACSAAIATGKVTLAVGADVFGKVTLADGKGSLTTTTGVSGTYEIVASYWGDSNCEVASSTALKQVVKQYPTSTALASNLNPSTYGQPVTFTAKVTSSSGTPPDGETVSFMKGTTVLGTGTLSSGSASFAATTLKIGTNSIKAVYAGDANFDASTSKAVSQVVEKATTTTTLTSSLNPSNFGQSVTFTATVAPQFSGTPTGTVTFNNGSTKLGTVSLSGGVASYTTTKLAVGTEPITAAYNGSSSFTTSTSNALSQAVNQASTTTTLVSSLNPSTYKEAVTFTATVSPQFSGTVTGTVTFYDGTTALETKSLSGGKAKFTTAKLAAGVHSITATYNGSTDFTGSSSAPLTQTVN